ncbi:glycoside hydrolase family 2 TIM barrel-domain containing protein [Confluentibacter citreus]|uniref:glycoside hydrolase family 2 TIM barrel-domain containing protein n=1 Tax=Confluentibacter citreus TaxID=2007307 RepID=UPI000C282370|nr:glycoside hydrolase family 2 TIM barrel-domain containing protein [Confluentibacter citreus]
MKRLIKIVFLFIVVFLVSLVFLLLYTHRDKKSVVDNTKDVYIVEDSVGFKLFRKGEPFIIKGAAGNGEHLEALSDIGGNTIRLYDTTNIQSILDRAYNNNIAVIVDIPIPKYDKEYNFYSNEENITALKSTVKNFVNAYKNHPALLFWSMGNELEYPEVFIKNDFIKTFNDLVDMVHDLDRNHPVGTSNQYDRWQILSINLHSPNLDFIGLNIFGSLYGLSSRYDELSYLIKQLPYYISEFGSSGPWESKTTSWGAPIEYISTKKGEQYVNQYNSFIATDKKSMGSLVFYWAQKQERTHTWFSIFDEEGRKSQIYYDMQACWGESAIKNDFPPKLKDMTINGKRAEDELIYKPNDVKTATLHLEGIIDAAFKYQWEIYEEGWYYKLYDNEKKPKLILKSLENQGDLTFTFITPNIEGPYRIFVHVYDEKGNFSTANIPFYVLEAHD